MSGPLENFAPSGLMSHKDEWSQARAQHASATTKWQLRSLRNEGYLPYGSGGGPLTEEKWRTFGRGVTKQLIVVTTCRKLAMIEKWTPHQTQPHR